MLTRVEISGFKSFEDFALDLEPLVMVLGPNSAGKSNLFDALSLISRLSTKEVAAALQGGRGSVRDQFSRTVDGIAQQMSFAIELLVSDAEPVDALAQTRFRYEVVVARMIVPSGPEQLSIVHELLRPIAKATDLWMLRHPRYAKLARYGLTEPVLALEHDSRRLTELQSVAILMGPGASRGVLPDHAVVVVDSPRGAGDHPTPVIRALPDLVTKALLAEEATPRAAHVLAAATELRGWRFLHPGMAALRASSERFASPGLASDGSGLPTTLAALPEEARARVRADMVALVPGLKTLDVSEGADEFGFEATFSDGQRYSQRVLSDGTLRLVALLTVLHSSRAGVLVAYEEPENGLHPGRLRELLRWLRELAERDDALPIQILMNGHSPTILAGLRDLPDSLIFLAVVRRKDGLRRTNARRMAPIGELAKPGITVGMHEIEALLDTTRPEIAE